MAFLWKVNNYEKTLKNKYHNSIKKCTCNLSNHWHDGLISLTELSDCIVCWIYPCWKEVNHHINFCALLQGESYSFKEAIILAVYKVHDQQPTNRETQRRTDKVIHTLTPSGRSFFCSFKKVTEEGGMWVKGGGNFVMDGN